jgi:hypothetical protein
MYPFRMAANSFAGTLPKTGTSLYPGGLTETGGLQGKGTCMTSIPRRVWLIAIVVGGFVLPGSPAGADPADIAHLPDIRTKKPSQLFIQNSGGVKELRFTNTIWNKGAGPLELEALNDDVTGTTVATQNIYSHEANGTPYLFDTNEVGTFAFHPQHNHWHFEGFAMYQVRKINASGGVGRVLKESDKISFCIIPTTFVTNQIPHAGWQPNPYNCGENSMQGLPVGYGDQYYYGLAGQFVPINGLADGKYWLRSEADWESRLMEEDETNNANKVKIRITGNNVTVIG